MGELLSKVSEKISDELLEIIIKKLNDHVIKILKGNSFQNKIAAYMHYFYNINAFVTSLALGNNKRLIDEIYQPLTIVKNNSQEKYYIYSCMKEMFSKYRNLMIIDQAGMGKSTIVKFLGMQWFREACGIPIIIELRNWKDIV